MAKKERKDLFKRMFLIFLWQKLPNIGTDTILLDHYGGTIFCDLIP
jgi:hypothetical protein